MSLNLSNMSSDDIMGWSAIVVAILAALITGIVSGIKQIRGARRLEDAADHEAWLTRVRAMTSAMAEMETRMATMEAEAKAFYQLLPNARTRAAHYEANVLDNAKRLDEIEATIAEIKGIRHG